MYKVCCCDDCILGGNCKTACSGLRGNAVERLADAKQSSKKSNMFDFVLRFGVAAEDGLDRAVWML